MFTKKQYYILIFLVIILIGAIFIVLKSRTWTKTSVQNSPTPTTSATPSVSPGPKTQKDFIMEDAAQKIAEISPVKPTLGGHWLIDRFWFVSGSDSDFYIEYEDGHILRRILLQATKENGSFKYRLVAYFEPGESDWVLKIGKDEQYGKNLDLYELNSAISRWIKKN